VAALMLSETLVWMLGPLNRVVPIPALEAAGGCSE
jgi:hypothetical protein